ncbi:hypothetical protein TYRP_008525 [Tyrophagus putrescentiae]|nr:hypothetical protein TYRP_008525 [Tyrophagus putrescentiae]
MFIYKNACAVLSPRHPFTDDVTYSHYTRLPAVTPPSQDPRPTTASELLKWSGRGHWFQMVQVDLFPLPAPILQFCFRPLHLYHSVRTFPLDIQLFGLPQSLLLDVPNYEVASLYLSSSSSRAS